MVFLGSNVGDGSVVQLKLDEQDRPSVHGSNIGDRRPVRHFLLLFSLHDFVFQEQLVLCIPANGMQFIALHQIINILATAFKDLAGFTDADDPMLNKSDEVIQRERN